jgi:hypothetical protein
VWLLLASLMIICTTGSNETIVMIAIELFIYNIFVNGYSRSFSRHYILYIILLLCFAVVAVSHGNYIRMHEFHNNMNIMDALKISAVALGKLTGLFVQSPVFLMLTLLFILNMDKITANTSIFEKLSNFRLIYIYPLAIFSLYVLYVPPAMAMGINPPLRIHNTVAFAFIVIWLVVVGVTVLKFKKNYPNINFTCPAVVSKMIIVVTIFLLLTDFYKEPNREFHFRGNVVRAVYDLLFVAKDYDAEMKNRYAVINDFKARKQNTMLTVPAIKHIPKTIFFIDMKADTAYDYNNGIANYFGISKIKTR